MFKWETEEERLLRHMKIPPKKKLQWLYEMNKFLDKYTPKKYKAMRRKLREAL
ncbi:MAG: hypothetical protein WC616_04165 [Candidatus Omnitrophota bacterium]